MATTILRVLGACSAITALVVLMGGSLPTSFTVSPAAAADGAPLAPAPGAAGEYERYVAPESACTRTDVASPSDADRVTEMACLLDYARMIGGAGALRRSRLLAASAAIKAEDIVRCTDFSHTACGHSVNAPFEQARYIALRFSVELSENLGACGAADSPRAIMRAWLDSTAHRSNVLNPRWLDGGVALRTMPAVGGHSSRAIWVSHFGRREAVAAEFSSPLSVAAAGQPASIGLRPSVQPARAPSGRLTSFRFLVTSMSTGTRRTVAGASIFFATRRARTNAQGRATIVARLPRPGRYRAIALSGGQQATVSVQIVHRWPRDSPLIPGPPSLGSAVDSSSPARGFSTSSRIRAR